MVTLVKAEMAGLIQDLMVEPGASVGREDEIILMSAMKMEIPVLAGRDGIVAEILVEVGDSVKAGEILFTIEP